MNPQKFPDGLRPLIDEVERLGMKFGLWVEPEMVNPDSELYRRHPEWALSFPGRPRTEARNQLMLNMARNDVKEHIFQALDRLLSENRIVFLKWDMNRHVSEPGWDEKVPAEQRKLWVQYVLNVYEIIDRLRAKHPRVEIESCSGGGGRVDLGILRRVEQVWTSDNTDALDRWKIQEGFTMAYTPKVMMAWTTDVPNFNGRSTPLDFRFLTAMQGSLGIGNNLNKWSAAEMKVAAEMIAWYKTVRATVQEGHLYRLRRPSEGEQNYNQYVSPDGRQSVVFALQRSQQYGRRAGGVSPRSGRKSHLSTEAAASGSSRPQTIRTERRLPDVERAVGQSEGGLQRNSNRAGTDRLSEANRKTYSKSRTDRGCARSHAMVSVTPPEISVQAVEVAVRIASSRVGAVATAQFFAPW